MVLTRTPTEEAAGSGKTAILMRAKAIFDLPLGTTRDDP